jgi:glyoxylase-like metal-dependent hydrolase (beta-lactamase superfamily II)
VPAARAFHVIKAWLPIPSLKAVNIYPHPRSGGSVDLVDAGMYTARCIHDIIRGLRSLDLDPCRLERIVVTHFHVDHLTGAAILAEATGAEVMLGRGELEYVLNTGDPAPFIDAALKLFVENGMPRAEVELIRKSHPAMRAIEAYKALSKLDIEPLGEGDTVRVGDERYKVLEMPGHTPGHIILVEEREGYAFTGDVVLKDITPHVTLHEPESDPLGDYMRSLERLASLGLKLALPGHRDPLEDPARRAREILEHHRQRLAEVHAILERHGEATGYQVAREVKWRVRYNTWEEYPPAERFFAMGEALAHLRRLEVEGRAEKVERGGLTIWRPL